MYFLRFLFKYRVEHLVKPMGTTENPSTYSVDSSRFGREFGSLHVTNAISPREMIAIGVSDANASALLWAARFLGDVVTNPVTIPHPNGLSVVSVVVLPDFFFIGWHPGNAGHQQHQKGPANSKWFCRHGEMNYNNFVLLKCT